MTPNWEKPAPLSNEIFDLLRRLSEAVFERYGKQKIPPFQTEWHQFFMEWAADDKAPLLIRRTSPIWMDDSRAFKIIFCDNSPAHWSTTKAFDNKPPVYSTETVEKLVRSEIPLFATLSKKERAEIGNLHPGYEEINQLWSKSGEYSRFADKWRVDHIQDVGVKKRSDGFKKMSRLELKPFFLRLMSPGNIFLTPKTLAGIGDMEVYLDYMRKQNRSFMSDFD
jgi:hypothetical protein